MSRQRVTEARVAHLARQLSQRDLSVIETLDRVRLASVRQLQRLHVTDGSPASNLRRTQQILTRLTRHRIVARLERRVGGVRSGSAGFVYGLDVAGQRLASACGPAGGVRIRRPWTPGAMFVDHALAVTELYVELREVERSEYATEIIEFDTEPYCWRTFAGIGGGRVVLKPDAFIRLGLGSFEDSYFIEMDRATQSGAAVARKLRLYRRYFESGREQHRLGVFPRVLFVVPTAIRKQALVDLAAAQPAESWPLFAIVEASDTTGFLTAEQPS